MSLVSRFSLGPGYLNLWLASAVSNLGDGIALIGAPLLAASLTRDPILVAGLSFSQRLPWLLFALPGGVLVDRLDRRRVMGIVNVGQTVLIGGLGMALLFKWTSIPLLYVVFFLLGATETIFDNASQTILPNVVARDRLPAANGQLYTAELVTNNFAGPPLGGLLFSVAVALPFLVDAGSFAASAALVLAMRGQFRSERAATASVAGLRADLAEGLRWLWRHRVLRIMALMVGLMNMLTLTAFATFVLFAQEVIGLGGAEYGALRTSGAVGGVIGSLVAARILRRLGTGQAILGAFLVNAVTFAAIAAFPRAIFVGSMLALSALSVVVWNVATVSYRQAVVPEHLLGRVNSAYRLLASGGTALGAPVGGVLAQRFGLTAPFWVTFIALVVVALVALPLVNNQAIRQEQEAEALGNVS